MRYGFGFAKLVQGLAIAALAIILFYPALMSVTINGHLLWFGNGVSAGGDFSFSTWLALLLTAGDAGALNALSANFLRSCSFFALLCLGVIPGSWPAHLKKLYLGLAVFLFLGLLSAVLGMAPYDATVAWGNGAAAVCVFVVASVLAYRHNTGAPLWNTVGMLAISAAVTMLFAWGMYTDSLEAKPVMYGTFYNQNLMSGWLLMLLPSAFLAVWKDDGAFAKRWVPAVGVVLLSALLVTLYYGYNRTAWAVGAFVLLLTAAAGNFLNWKRSLISVAAGSVIVLSAVAAAVWGWQGRVVLACLGAAAALLLSAFLLKGCSEWRQPRTLKRLGVCLLLGLALMGGLGCRTEWGTPRAADRLRQLAQGQDESGLARWEFFQAAWRISLDHVLLGVGPQGFSRYYPMYQNDARWYSRYSHCLILDLLCEYGWLNGVLFLALCGYGMWLAIGLWRQDGDERSVWRLGLMMGLLGLFLHAQADVDAHFATLVISGALLAGVILGTPSREWAISDDEEPRSELSIRPSMLRQYLLTGLVTALLVLNARCAVGDYYGTYAKYCRDHNQLETALGYYRSAVANSPFNSDYRCRLSQTIMDLRLDLSKEDNQAELDENSLTAVLCDPYQAKCHDVRGQSLEYMGRWQEALGHYQQALAIDACNLPSAYYDAARVCMHFEKPDAAKEVLELGLQRVTAPNLLQGLNSPFKLTPDAAEVYECVLQMMPSREGWRWEFIKALEELGLDSAFILYLRGEAYLDLADWQYKANNPQQGKIWLEQAHQALEQVAAAKGPKYRRVQELLTQCAKKR
ncbi:O-antigen ligase family protein [bacterium]|nr:O-antigen ligase family protein [bacterium]